jgi:hypothetical protein
MRNLIFAALSLLFGLSSTAEVDPAAKQPTPTARDLYIGCYLLLHNTDVPADQAGTSLPFSAEKCAVTSVLAIAAREGANTTKDNQFRFCIPDGSQESQNPAIAMAAVYLDFYEMNGPRLAANDGATVYVSAMILKWPCASSLRSEP